jgi:hypothetical protein
MMKIDFLENKKNIYSQNGEDGIINALFKIIGFKSHVCCEFGAWDGIHFSNTKALIDEGFSAFMIEADKVKFNKLLKTYENNKQVVCLNAFVNTTDQTLSKLLRNKGIEDWKIDTMDLLSIDIDGLDYEIFETLDIRPRVIVIEVNAGHDPSNKSLIPREIAKNIVGQPLSFFSSVAESKGYVLVAYNGNAFYILKEIATVFDILPLSDEEAYGLFLKHLNEKEKQWLCLVNEGKVVPFYKFNNPLLTPKNLNTTMPVVPMTEKFKKVLKLLK